MLTAATEQDVRRFMETNVRPALVQMAEELTAQGRISEILTEDDDAIVFRSPAEGVRDFVYGVSLTSHRVASFTTIRAGQPELRYEARTYFSSGNRGYDLMGMSRDQILADVLIQFERYLHLVNSPDMQLVHGAPEHPSGV
jgi:choline/glycine/proline betaine transport protein